jgi:hypothetical protein
MVKDARIYNSITVRFSDTTYTSYRFFYIYTHIETQYRLLHILRDTQIRINKSNIYVGTLPHTHMMYTVAPRCTERA